MARILVLDDEEDICNLVRRILSGSGHEVVTFTRAGDALQWLKSNRPDLALLDFKLRESDGLVVLSYLRSHCPEVKSIMITGQPSPKIRKKAAELGLEDYLLKPLEISVLEEHVNRSLGQECA